MHLSKKATPLADASSEQCSSALVVSPTGGIVDLAMAPAPPTPERRPRHATTPSSRPVSTSGARTAPSSSLVLGM
ncbi:unnamed protein product [Ectocarpus sp. 12 AP-2014]